MKCLSFDQHTPTHFFGCYALSLTLMIWGFPWWLACLLTIGAGIGWEVIGDGYLGAKKFYPMFDTRGADICDIIVDSMGALLGTLVGCL